MQYTRGLSTILIPLLIVGGTVYIRLKQLFNVEAHGEYSNTCSTVSKIMHFKFFDMPCHINLGYEESRMWFFGRASG